MESAEGIVVLGLSVGGIVLLFTVSALMALARGNRKSKPKGDALPPYYRRQPGSGDITLQQEAKQRRWL